MIRRFILLFAAASALLVHPLAARPAFPELSGRVVDAADIMPPEIEAQLTADLEALETQTQRQMVIATVADLGGLAIEDYGLQLARDWAIGDAERNDGVVLLVAPNDRKVRIEVGYGLEGILTDAFASHIIQSDILPRFRDGDMPGGIVAGSEALVTHLGLSEEEAMAALEAQKQASKPSPMWALALIIIIPGFFLLFIVMIGAATSKTRKRHGGFMSGGGPVSTYSSSGSSWSSSSSSFSSSSFSGGGGSFGGGGASGGW